MYSTGDRSLPRYVPVNIEKRPVVPPTFPENILSRASKAFDALDKIFSGKVGGTTGLFSILTGTYLGSERSPVEYKTEGEKRIVNVGKKIQGVIKPIEGLEKGKPVTFQNSTYWMGPEVIISTAEQGRVRAFGRVWDFEGRSAESVSYTHLTLPTT